MIRLSRNTLKIRGLLLIWIAIITAKVLDYSQIVYVQHVCRDLSLHKHPVKSFLFKYFAIAIIASLPLLCHQALELSSTISDSGI